MPSIIRRFSLLVLPLGLLGLVAYLSRDDDRTKPGAIIVTATDDLPAPGSTAAAPRAALGSRTDGPVAVAPAITLGEQVRLERRDGASPGAFRYFVAAFRPLGDDQPDLRTGDEVVAINGVAASAYLTVEDMMLDLERPGARLTLLRNGSTIEAMVPEAGL
jgi:hypothetical protein